MFSRKLLLSFHQQKNYFIKEKFLACVRKWSNSQPLRSLAVDHLEHRNLFKVWGPDSSKFLQGILTNDIYSFDPTTNDTSCIYAMVLNVQGRVLYDTLVYKLSQDEYLLEYDSAGISSLRKHLDMFRLRKQVDVKPVDDKSIWVAYSPMEQNGKKEMLLNSANFIGHLKSKQPNAIAVSDPRISFLGYRLILQKDFNLKGFFEDLNFYVEKDSSYELLRYKLGVGEGVRDHPPEDCLPLECNLDYLNGVSFEKGCYIGQELTARIHHTGIVRKRLMPIILSELRDFPSACNIINEKGLRMGRLRSNVGIHGLAALNSEESLKAQTLVLKGYDVVVNVTKPKWWPHDQGKIQRFTL